MCRFLLHLCEASEADPNRSIPSVFATISFASGMMVGNEGMLHRNHNTPNGYSLTAHSLGDDQELVVFGRGIMAHR